MKRAAQQVAAHLRGGSGDELPRETSVAGPTDFATEHDSRVRCSRRLGGLPLSQLLFKCQMLSLTPNSPREPDAQLLLLANDNELRFPLNPHPVESLPKLLPTLSERSVAWEPINIPHVSLNGFVALLDRHFIHRV